MKSLLVCCLGLAAVLASPPAQAQQDTVVADASRHFQRGVELYGEGDFRGALVEFKSAYGLLPRAPVLYDIGQTEFQMQEYAQALQTLERFLVETGPNAAHHAEVKDTVEVLRGRVGRIDVKIDRAACDVTVDDQPAGTTPLPQPVLVSVGRRRVAVSCAGHSAGVRTVEVAAGQLVPLVLAVASPPPAAPVAVSALVAPAAPRISRRTMITAWTITGVLAVATASFYAATLVESRRLDDLRGTFPLMPERFNDRLNLTSGLALTGDILAIVTLVAAGTSTYLSVSGRTERPLQVGVAWGGVTVRGSF